jgi:circadian clock protein KaiC
VSNERVSTGIPRLDAMLSGRGFFRGSSILLTGTAGTGKTSVAACFAQAAARRRERVLFFSFEESPTRSSQHAFHQSHLDLWSARPAGFTQPGPLCG